MWSTAGGTEEEARNKLGKACPLGAPANSAAMLRLTATVETSASGVCSSKQRQLGRLGNTARGRNVCTVTGEGTEYSRLEGIKPARGSELLEGTEEHTTKDCSLERETNERSAQVSGFSLPFPLSLFTFHLLRERERDCMYHYTCQG